MKVTQQLSLFPSPFCGHYLCNLGLQPTYCWEARQIPENQGFFEGVSSCSFKWRSSIGRFIKKWWSSSEDLAKSGYIPDAGVHFFNQPSMFMATHWKRNIEIWRFSLFFFSHFWQWKPSKITTSFLNFLNFTFWLHFASKNTCKIPTATGIWTTNLAVAFRLINLSTGSWILTTKIKASSMITPSFRHYRLSNYVSLRCIRRNLKTQMQLVQF